QDDIDCELATVAGRDAGRTAVGALWAAAAWLAILPVDGEVDGVLHRTTKRHAPEARHRAHTSRPGQRAAAVDHVHDRIPLRVAGGVAHHHAVVTAGHGVAVRPDERDEPRERSAAAGVLKAHEHLERHLLAADEYTGGSGPFT